MAKVHIICQFAIKFLPGSEGLMQGEGNSEIKTNIITERFISRYTVQLYSISWINDTACVPCIYSQTDPAFAPWLSGRQFVFGPLITGNRHRRTASYKNIFQICLQVIQVIQVKIPYYNFGALFSPNFGFGKLQTAKQFPHFY